MIRSRHPGEAGWAPRSGRCRAGPPPNPAAGRRRLYLPWIFLHFDSLRFVAVGCSFGFSFFFLATNTCYFIIKTQNQKPVSSSFQPAWEASGALPWRQGGTSHALHGAGAGTPGPRGAASAQQGLGRASGAELTELPGCSHQEAHGRASCPAPTAPQTQARGEPSSQGTWAPRSTQAALPGSRCEVESDSNLRASVPPQGDGDGGVTAGRSLRLNELVCVKA